MADKIDPGKAPVLPPVPAHFLDVLGASARHYDSEDYQLLIQAYTTGARVMVAERSKDKITAVFGPSRAR